MTQTAGKKRTSAAERAHERVDVRAQLSFLEAQIAQLKADYEQHFLGNLPYAPDKLHREVKMLIRKLLRAPFKNSQMTFTLRTLESRYNTYNTYWQRIQRQREEGTYSRDVFKANMRERHQQEDVESHTAKGKATGQMQSLFQTYQNALEKQSGKKQHLDFAAFKKSLVKRAKEYQKKNGKKKLTFKVVVKDGKVTVQAKGK